MACIEVEHIKHHNPPGCTKSATHSKKNYVMMTHHFDSKQSYPSGLEMVACTTYPAYPQLQITLPMPGVHGLNAPPRRTPPPPPYALQPTPPPPYTLQPTPPKLPPPPPPPPPPPRRTPPPLRPPADTPQTARPPPPPPGVLTDSWGVGRIRTAGSRPPPPPPWPTQGACNATLSPMAMC